MIYRRWSLLTGPPAILGGIVAAVIVTEFIFPKDLFSSKPDQEKKDVLPSTK